MKFSGKCLLIGFIICTYFIEAIPAFSFDEGFVYSQEGRCQRVSASTASRHLVKIPPYVEDNDKVHLSFSVRLAAELYAPYGLDIERLKPVTVYPYLPADGLNAHFNPSDNSLNFHVYPTLRGQQLTCRSLDIVAHEAGHWSHFSARPDLFTSQRPQTGALRESFGDLTAIFVRVSNRIASPAASAPQMCLASDIGECVRDARNSLTIATLLSKRDACEVHSLSRVFTAAMFTAFENALSNSRVPTRTLNDFIRAAWLSFTQTESSSPSLTNVAILAINQSGLKDTRGYLASSFVQRGILSITPDHSLSCNELSCSACDVIITNRTKEATLRKAYRGLMDASSAA